MNQNYYITEAVHNIKEFTDIGMFKKQNPNIDLIQTNVQEQTPGRDVDCIII